MLGEPRTVLPGNVSLSKVLFLSIKIVKADHRKLTVSTNFNTDIFDGKVPSKLLTQQVNVDRKFLIMQVVRRSGFPLLERDHLSMSHGLWTEFWKFLGLFDWRY
jgi:hypothetical protein